MFRKYRKDKELRRQITNQLLAALLNELYTIELVITDANAGKHQLRWSNKMVLKDKQVLDAMVQLVEKDVLDGLL